MPVFENALELGSMEMGLVISKMQMALVDLDDVDVEY